MDGNDIKAILDVLNEGFERIDRRFDALEQRLDKIEERVTSLEERVTSLETSVKKMEIESENTIMPTIKEMHCVYMGTYKRYADGADKMEQIGADVVVMKDVIARHSEEILNFSIAAN